MHCTTLLYCTVLYSTILTVLYSTILYCALLDYTDCALLNFTVHCTTLLYSTLLHCALHYTTLLYSTLLYSTLLHYHRQSRLFCILSFLSRYHELLHQINFIPSPTDCQTIPHTRHLRSHRPNHSYALAHLHLLSSAL